jgi:hypothetical protein
VKKTIYLVAAIIGLLFPYYFLFFFLRENGLDISLLLQQLFENRISTFFAIDLILSIIVFWFYMYSEAKKLQMKNWWLYILASLTVGLSFALPLFLYFRERQSEK